MQISTGTPLFKFVSSDATSKAIIDVLTPLTPLVKNNLFVRGGLRANVYVTHSKNAMLSCVKVDGVTSPLTDIESAILEVFYTQSK